MQNNNEFVVYTKKEIQPGEAQKHVSYDMYDEIHLVFSRPVFSIEIEDELDIADGQANEAPDITRFLDSLYRLKSQVDLWKAVQKANEKAGQEKKGKKEFLEFIIKSVTHQFYDCMSGGMPGFLGSIAIEIANACPEIKTEELEVYPKKTVGTL